MNEVQATLPKTTQLLGPKPNDTIKSPAVEKSADSSQADVAPDLNGAAPSSEVVQQDLEKAVSRLNDYVQSSQRDLKFSMDEESGQTVITVVDRYTSEVIRQLPDQVVLDLAKKLNQEEPIKLFSAHA